MAEGFAAGVANAILDALCRSVSWTEPAVIYVQLHTAAPGADGTANVATETDRIQATFGDAAASGAISNTVALTWEGVAGSEDYTHCTLWDDLSAGNFQASGAITASAVTAGNDFTIPIGGLDVSLPVAS
jgi:hypothetical protein